MSIYIITHKYLDKDPTNKLGYKKLYVGAFKQKERRPEYLYDDVGCSISEKNTNYCELTGLYWIWKNQTDSYKGVVHYRRFFTKNKFSDSSFYFYSEPELVKKLGDNDCLVFKRLYVAEKNIYLHYCKYHNESDLIQTKSVIDTKFPEYRDAFDKAFSLNYFYPCNMIFAKSTVFDAYCDWLFDVLQYLEEIIDISNYDSVQSRIYGFLSERLLNVWLQKNEINYLEVPVVELGTSFKYRVRLGLDSIVGRAIREGNKY